MSRPGVYQWARAFNTGKNTGEIRHINTIAPNDLKNYDFCHMNLCGVSATAITKVKAALAGSDTKLIVNLDYAIEIVQEGFERPREMWEALMAADFVFVQEPFQQNFVSFFLKYHNPGKTSKFQAALVPHPCDTIGLKELRVPNEDRLDMCAIMIHRYREHVIIPAMITWGLRSLTWGVGFTTGAIPIGLFVDASPMLEWPKYLYKLSHCTTALDLYLGVHSHSRFCEETACLGVVTVSSQESYMGKLLFPEISHNETDLQGIRNDLEKLEDGFDKGEPSPFYLELQEKASQRVEAYNWENSKNRLFEAMRAWEIKI